MLLILFGLPGSGKNFVGRILQEDFGFLFHDADDDLPDEMREAIQSQQIPRCATLICKTS
jgi:gluconokinase